ncbi:MAG: peptide-methionine (S)-S-oxide reductase MsrA, partial [Sphingomonas sp.]
SGYAGGGAATAKYDEVGSGRTGHAEAVRISFNPAEVSDGRLLQIYFSVIADPTTLNAQGPDRGTQYRSALFPLNAGQKQVAAAYLAQLGKARVWDRPIVTRIERAQGFFPAERYHQNYLALNPTAGYIVVNDMPKVTALKSFYPQLWRQQPVLVKG